VRSAVALTSTTLGPSLGASDDVLPAQIFDRGRGGGVDVSVTSGSLANLHGDSIALGRHRASAAYARIGGRVPLMLGNGTRTRAIVVAIYTRDLASEMRCSLPSSPPDTRTTRCSERSSYRPRTRRPSPRASALCALGIPGCA
jgi:hypothetical protein